jgi:hypothetical protein
MARGAGVPGGCRGAAADGPVRAFVVAVAGEGVELGLQPADGGGGVLAGEPFFQGLVEALDLAAGLRVVGAGAAVGDPEGGELAFQRDPAAAAVAAGEHGRVVGEHLLREAVAGHGGVQAGDDVAGFEDRPGGGASQQPGVVVGDVEDLGVAAVGQRPVGDVGLPALVGQVGLETGARTSGAACAAAG